MVDPAKSNMLLSCDLLTKSKGNRHRNWGSLKSSSLLFCRSSVSYRMATTQSTLSWPASLTGQAALSEDPCLSFPQASRHPGRSWQCPHCQQRALVTFCDPIFEEFLWVLFLDLLLKWDILSLTNSNSFMYFKKDLDFYRKCKFTTRRKAQCKIFF